MKRALALLILPIFLSAQADISTVKDSKWLTDFGKALNTAKKNKKNVLVYFTGSDWCPPCKMLKKDLFDTYEFEEISKEYVLLYVDIPRNANLLSPEQMEHNKELLLKYNKNHAKATFRALFWIMTNFPKILKKRKSSRIKNAPSIAARPVNIIGFALTAPD